MAQVAFADGGGANDEVAVGDGFGDGGADGRGVEDGGGIDGGARAFERHGEVVDDAEVGEAEVMHRPGDGADVIGVARADEDDSYPGESRFIQHEDSFQRFVGPAHAVRPHG